MYKLYRIMLQWYQAILATEKKTHTHLICGIFKINLTQHVVEQCSTETIQIYSVDRTFWSSQLQSC